MQNQANYIERLRRYIEQQQLCSVMNNTKWREVLDALDNMPNASVQFRAKCLGEAPSVLWDTSFPEHVPYPFLAIEWLEINPIERYSRGALLDDEVVDFSDEIEAALQSVPVPYTKEDGLFRIWGYLPSGSILMPV